MRIGWMLALLLTLPATTAHAASIPGAPAPNITFRCNIVAGPKLEACLPIRGGKGLDPRKIVHLQGFAERSCLKGDEVVGGVFETTIPFQDSPQLLKPFPKGESIITYPDWLSQPGVDATMAAYPPAAAATKTPGQAMIRCTVAVDTHLRDCQVVSEAPAGQGFGAAALTVAESIRMRPMLKDCEPVDGGKVMLPLRFEPGR